MTSGDLLSLIAELAIALVAAAGIVTAIGGRDRDYTATDRARIRSLIIVAATPLAVALLGLVTLSAEVQPTAPGRSSALRISLWLGPASHTRFLSSFVFPTINLRPGAHGA
jgi:hypothetical protein